MGKYKMQMNGETAPKKKVLLPIGWRRFKIDTIEEMTSKSGNPMFKFTLFDLETLSSHDVYAVSTEGKRWFLKMLLAACNVAAAADGVYDWDTSDVLNQIVQGRIEHEPNDWVDRNGVQRTEQQSKIVEIREDSGAISGDGTFETENGKKF